MAELKQETKEEGKQETATADKPTSTASKEVISNVAERLRFFFSNANLRNDKFLRPQVLGKDPAYISIETLLTFNTIKKYSKNPADLVRAVKEDEQIKTRLKLDENESSISRVVPFTKEILDNNKAVTLRVSNIPVSGPEGNESYSVERDEVVALFKEFGYVSMVKLIHAFKDGSKRAIGRAFVEFEEPEGMEKAAAELCLPGKWKDQSDKEEQEKPKRTLKIGENEIRVKTLQQFIDKRAAKKAKWLEGRGKDGNQRNEKRSRDRNNRGKNGKEGSDNASAEPIEFKLDWVKGRVISVKGLPEECDREKILEAVQDFVGKDVRFRADYSRGQKDGAIRFEQSHDKISELAEKLNDGSITIGGSKVEAAELMKGEVEEKYYKEFIACRTKHMQNKADERGRKKPRYRR